ncbi:MAG: hypothetical protein NXI10_07520 [bacterium]|nr:hypothetical protein [bacterium]
MAEKEDIDTTRSKLAVEKDQLDNEKLRLEIKDMQRRWYAKPAFLGLILPSVVAFFIGLITDYISLEEARIGHEKQREEFVSKSVQLRDSLQSMEAKLQQDSILNVKLQSIRALEFLTTYRYYQIEDQQAVNEALMYVNNKFTSYSEKLFSEYPSIEATEQWQLVESTFNSWTPSESGIEKANKMNKIINSFYALRKEVITKLAN